MFSVEAIVDTVWACTEEFATFQQNQTYDLKSDDSPVSALDRAIEWRLREWLQANYPRDAIHGEEFPPLAGDSGFSWLIDPIDGTRSLISGSPLFGILLGRLSGEWPHWGLCAMPALREMYWTTAESGGGVMVAAQGNNARLLAPPPPPPEDARRLRVFVAEAELFVRHHPALLQSLMQAYPQLRFEHDCYTFVRLVQGRIDAIVEADLCCFDILPVVPLIEAVGGKITDWQGKALRYRAGDARYNIVAARSPELHAELLAHTERTYK